MFSRIQAFAPAVIPRELLGSVLAYLRTDPLSAADPLGLTARAKALIDGSVRSADTQPFLDALVLIDGALAAVPPGHPDRHLHLAFAHEARAALAVRTGSVQHVDERIRLAREMLVEIPPTSALYPNYLTALGAGLRTRFLYTHDIDALNEALATCRKAVAMTPPDDPERTARINVLARVLKAMHIVTDEQDYREEKTSLLRKSVAMTPPGHPDRAASVSALGEDLVEAAQISGNVDQLDEALGYLREAVGAGSRNQTEAGHPDPEFLRRLGAGLRVRYELTRDLGALQEAIVLLRNAIDLVGPDDDPPHVKLDDLAAALEAMFERTEDLSALEESVLVTRKALAATPPGAVNLALYLTNLASRLRRLYEYTKNVDVLDEAIESVKEAIAARSEPVYSARRLALLGILQGLRSIHDGEVGGIEKAIATMRESVAALPVGHPGRLEPIRNLAVSLRALHAAAPDVELLKEARGYFQEVADSLSAPLEIRVNGCMQLAVTTEALGDGEAALAAVERAVELAEALTLDGVTEADRAHRLGELMELPAQAASAALLAGRPSRAVELLERTRGVLAAETLRQRGGEVERLRAADSGLAAELVDVRGRLTSSTPKRVRAAYRDLATLLERIRRVPGFEGFQRPPRIDQLARLVRSGPVVLISAGQYRSDALIITGDGGGGSGGDGGSSRGSGDPVELVRLPGLDREEAARQAERLARAGRAALRDLSPASRRVRVRDEVVDILAWLWDVAAEPVLDHLGFTGAPPEGQELPRLWWCPAHVLSYLPFHAAGRYQSAAEPVSVLDRVVSSYTTTISALAHRERPRRSIPATLIVPVPDTPGAPLPGVITETQALLGMIPDARPLLRPSRASVLEALPRHQIAHFACHGQADRIDPARSHLILADHDSAPLTLDDISHLNLTADLAYLSACSTGVAPVRLTDQFLHFTGAFQLAGFRHVIGTLWSVDDEVSAELAADFYDRLTSGGSLPPQTELSARALHEAIHALRAKYPDNPALWAAHTHTGG